MNIEEAIKILKKAKEPYYTEVVGSKWIKGYTTILGTEVDKAIDIVLNELDKKDKQIEEAYKEGYIKGVQPQIFENWKKSHAKQIKIS